MKCISFPLWYKLANLCWCGLQFDNFEHLIVVHKNWHNDFKWGDNASKKCRCDKIWSIIGRRIGIRVKGAFEHEEMVDDYQLEPNFPCWDTLILCPTFDK
jgi:hypothetical protein